MSYAYVSDGVHTLDGSAGCLPASTTVQGDPVAIGAQRVADLWLDMPGDANVTVAVELSPDGSRWFDLTPDRINTPAGTQFVARIATVDVAAMRVTVTNTGLTDCDAYALVAVAEAGNIAPVVFYYMMRRAQL